MTFGVDLPKPKEAANEEEYPHWRRQVALFLAGQAISLFGSGIVQFALIWHITMRTQSGEMVTIATLVALVPMVLLSPFGGVLADRYSRRLLIIGADLTVAASTALLLFAFITGKSSFWLIFVVMGVRSLGAGIQMPAVGAVLPQLVPPNELGRVNGYNASIQAAVNLLSPLLAGALLAVMPIQWALVIDLVTAAIGVGMLVLFVRIPRHSGAEAARERHPWHDMREGFKYVRKHQFLSRLIFYFGFINLFAAPVSILTPLQVTRTFANDVWHLTAIEVAFAVGMVLGGALAGLWGKKGGRVATVSWSIVLLALLTIALGFPIAFWLYCVWMFLAGVVMPFFQAPAITMVQLATDPNMLGRVFSVTVTISAGAIPVGMLLFGPFADTVSVETLLLISGALFLIIGVAMLCDKKLRAAEPSAVTDSAQ